MDLLKYSVLILGLSFLPSASAGNGVVTDDANEPALLFDLEAQPMDDFEAGLLSENPNAELTPMARVQVRCMSRNYRTTYCGVPGRIRVVRLVRQLSNAPCIAGRTFGATPRYVWVSRGCAGDFIVRTNRGRGDRRDDDKSRDRPRP